MSPSVMRADNSMAATATRVMCADVIRLPGAHVLAGATLTVPSGSVMHSFEGSCH